MEWALLPLKRYAEFSGRSRRKEYWLFALVMLVVYAVAVAIDSVLGLAFIDLYGPATIIAILALLIPSIAVTVRRLHDSDRSAWWLLLYLIPFLGGLILLILMVLDGTDGSNRFGPDPKAPDHAEVFA